MLLAQLRPVLVLLLGFTVILGLGMPALFVGIGGVAMPFQASGSLVGPEGHKVGSALIGQAFTRPGYFHGRGSALTGTDPKNPSKTVPTPYDASESGASNLAPTSAALIARVKGDVPGAGAVPVPADAVTTSGSGLDPDISPENARAQAARVAAARHAPVEAVAAIIDRETLGRSLGILGEPRVNVLALNRALDEAFPEK